MVSGSFDSRMNDQISFKSLNNVPEDQIKGNRTANRDRGIPKIGDFPVVPRLAIVGGGLGLNFFIEELKHFDGDVWAINGAYEWCRAVGIDAVFYAIDPSPLIIPLTEGVHNAVLADTVHRDVFDNLGDKVGEIAWTGLQGVRYGTTAAATAPMIAAERGHKHVTFYGCQSDFSIVNTHIYKNDKLSKIWVRCGGIEYITCPQFIMQAEFIAGIARILPKSIRVRGRGFLSSLIDHGTYKITHVIKSIKDSCERQTNE